MDGAAIAEHAERAGRCGSVDDLDGPRALEGEERVPAEAGIALAAVGVEDPDGRVAARRARPVPGDDDLGGLADDVPAEADPGLPGKLEADARPLPDRGGHRGHEARRLEDEERDPGPAGEGPEATEAIGEPGRTFRPRRQVNDEEVDGPARQERARDRQAFLSGRGREDDEPFRPDAAGHGLDRIEGRGEVQPGDDRATRLGLGGEPEGQRGPAARQVAPE
jgi:hypothetical protein